MSWNKHFRIHVVSASEVRILYHLHHPGVPLRNWISSAFRISWSGTCTLAIQCGTLSLTQCRVRALQTRFLHVRSEITSTGDLFGRPIYRSSNFCLVSYGSIWCPSVVLRDTGRELVAQIRLFTWARFLICKSRPLVMERFMFADVWEKCYQ